MITPNGWIRWHRKEREWLNELTDQEERYYRVARESAIWDPRNKLFGTFDARTRIVKELLPSWANGKINQNKNSLLRRGAFRKTDDPRRLQITNAHILMKVGHGSEKIIQVSEINLLTNECDFQASEKARQEIRSALREIAQSKRVLPPAHSEF